MTSWIRASLAVALGLALVGITTGCTVLEDGDGEDRTIDVLVISDSNGVGKGAWPHLLHDQIKSLAPALALRIQNESRPGRTLTVDRGEPETAAYLGIEEWIDSATARSEGDLDVIILCLGTNDIQKRFEREVFGHTTSAQRAADVVERITQLAPNAQVLISAPPPVCDEQDMDEPGSQNAIPIDPRWRGAGERRRLFLNTLETQAKRFSVHFVDPASGPTAHACELVQQDGVHLNRSGHRHMARVLGSALEPILTSAQ